MKRRLFSLAAWLFGYFFSLATCSPQSYQTLGAGSCGLGQNNCHARENEWWSGDKHYDSNQNFYGASAKVKEFATAYGITEAQANLGTSVCMVCHATAISAKREQQTEEGVGCESCHGAGSGYKENHSSEKGKGYEIGVRFGMVRNKEMPVRAQLCVSCHLISDAKLLTAGHPNGKRFDYEKGLAQVAKHFRTPDAPQERATFLAAVTRAKGTPAGIAPALAENAPPKPIAPKPSPQPAPRTEKRFPESLPPKIEEEATTDTAFSSTQNTIIAEPAPIVDSLAVSLPMPLPAPPPVFIPPPLPLGPAVKLQRKLELPPALSFKNVSTRADSIRVLENFLNALLQAVEEARSQKR